LDPAVRADLRRARDAARAAADLAGRARALLRHRAARALPEGRGAAGALAAGARDAALRGDRPDARHARVPQGDRMSAPSLLRSPRWVRMVQLLRKEFRQMLRDPRSRRMLFISPIIQLVIFGYAINTDVREVPTAIADHDRSEASRSLVDALTASDYFVVEEQVDRPADLVGALD